MPQTLDERLLQAHERGDEAALVTLYMEAADTANDPDAAGFYLTHAYVFALSIGAPEAAELNRRLAAEGREEPQPDL